MMKTRLFTILAGVTVLWIAQSAMATPVDSNSIIKNGIEYYMQTNKSIYNLGENVEMLYRVTNLRAEDVTFEFTCGPVDDRCDFIVDKDEQRIWDNLDRPSTDVITYFTLCPSESKYFTWSWDMIDLDGNQVVPRDYDVTGALSDLSLAYIEKRVPVSVQIEIIPEPSTLLLLGASLVGLLARNRKKKK
jgi:hypothetical protein